MVVPAQIHNIRTAVEGTGGGNGKKFETVSRQYMGVRVYAANIPKSILGTASCLKHTFCDSPVARMNIAMSPDTHSDVSNLTSVSKG